MRNRNDIIEAIVEQVEWSLKIGKVKLVDKEYVEETAEDILTAEEFIFAIETDAIRDALWCI